MNFVSTSSSVHLAKMEFLENQHHMQAFLSLAECRLKSWIIKYGRQETVELMLHNYIVSNHRLYVCKFYHIITYNLNCFLFYSLVVCRKAAFL